MLFMKTFKDVKFTVDDSALQKHSLLSTKKFCLMLAVYLGFILMAPIVSGSTHFSATMSPLRNNTKQAATTLVDRGCITVPLKLRPYGAIQICLLLLLLLYSGK